MGRLIDGGDLRLGLGLDPLDQGLGLAAGLFGVLAALAGLLEGTLDLRLGLGGLGLGLGLELRRQGLGLGGASPGGRGLGLGLGLGPGDLLLGLGNLELGPGGLGQLPDQGFQLLEGFFVGGHRVLLVLG